MTKTTTTQPTLTEMERAVLKAHWTNEYVDGQDRPSTWSFSVTDYCGLSKKSVPGVMSSLSKKGLIIVHPRTGRDEPESTNVTQLGFETARDAGLIFNSPLEDGRAYWQGADEKVVVPTPKPVCAAKPVAFRLTDAQMEVLGMDDAALQASYGMTHVKGGKNFTEFTASDVMVADLATAYAARSTKAGGYDQPLHWYAVAGAAAKALRKALEAAKPVHEAGKGEALATEVARVLDTHRISSPKRHHIFAILGSLGHSQIALEMTNDKAEEFAKRVLDIQNNTGK